MTTEQILSIVEPEDQAVHLVDFINECTSYDTPVKEVVTDWYENAYEPSDDAEPILALMECENFSYYEAETAINDRNYLVLTDEEADEAWEESLEQYLDDCVLPELPEQMQQYFDKEQWIKDAKYDGRSVLSTYDGNEQYCTINNTEYYVYRIN